MKTLVISGGSDGIGKATVERFCQAGYHCLILDIKEPKVKIPNTQFFLCDVANTEQIQATIEKIKESHSSVDALVCNAGVHFSATIQETSPETFDKIMNINFRGSFFLTQAILPLMLTQKKGAIVFVGSDQTIIVKPHSAIYAATKAALGSLARTTAIDYAQQGIRSNLVAAGTIDTSLYQSAVQRYCDKTGAEPSIVHISEGNEQPIGRIGKPEEVAHLIYFLCSDEAGFITGGIYPIDGGYTAR
ncbi:MAG: SDR family oxidoreductase [Legionellales bacterium]|jgi:NAD(P)-dependent dehydrogenase (short-subunit alcohol dehydrogenase family)